MGTSVAAVVDSWSSVENVRFVKESSIGTKITLDTITGLSKSPRGSGSSAKKAASNDWKQQQNIPRFIYFGDEVSPPASDFLKETRNPVLEAINKASDKDPKVNESSSTSLGAESYYVNNGCYGDVPFRNLRNVGVNEVMRPQKFGDDPEVKGSFLSDARFWGDASRADMSPGNKRIENNTRSNFTYNSSSWVEERTLGDGQESFRPKDDEFNSAKNIYSNVNKKQKSSNRSKRINDVDTNVSHGLCKSTRNETAESSLRDTSDMSCSSRSSTDGATTDTNLSVTEPDEEEQLSIQYLTRLRDILASTFDGIECSDEKIESYEQTSSDKKRSTERGNSATSSSGEEVKKEKQKSHGSLDDLFDDTLRFTTRNPAFLLNSKRHNKGFFKRTRSDLHLSNTRRPVSKHANPPDLALRRSKSVLNPPALDPLNPLNHQITLANVDLIRQNYLNSLNQISKVGQVDRLLAAGKVRSKQLNPPGDLDYALQAQLIQRLRQQQIIKQQQIQLQHQQQIQKQQQLINQIRQQRYLQVQKQKLLLQAERKGRNDSGRTRSRSRGRKDGQKVDRITRGDAGRKSRSSGKENFGKIRASNRSKSKDRSRSRHSGKERNRKSNGSSSDALNRNKVSKQDNLIGSRYDNDGKSQGNGSGNIENNGSAFSKGNSNDPEDDTDPDDGPIYATIATSHKMPSKDSENVSSKALRSRTLSPPPTTESSRQVRNKTRRSASRLAETSSSKKRVAPNSPEGSSKNNGADLRTETSKSSRRTLASPQEHRPTPNGKSSSSAGAVAPSYQDCAYIDPLDKVTESKEDGPVAQVRKNYHDNMKRIKTVDAPMRGGGPSSHHHAHHHRGGRSDRSSVDGAPPAVAGGGGDDSSSVGSESYAKDVAILNCCFDDIERFIARLQHTAAATQELEKRRRSRKNKKKEVGDGLLSMRAKPPPEIEFVEILQKFKLSFNMLGKLRTYIHEPNAPELVHFIFTPLALIVDASRDSNYGTNLPAKVVSPLLTQEAVDLLTNCLSSRETELWQSLDEAWIVPRELWKYPPPPYQPVFSSGWAPELSDEPPDPRAELKGRSREEYDDYYQSKHHGASPPPDRYSRHHPYSESEVSGSESASGPEGPGAAGPPQHQWLAELRRRGSRIVQVTYPRTANNDKELTVVRGEYLEVLDDSRKWWRCGNSRGQKAHVPHTIVTPFTPAMLNEGMAGAPSNDWGPKDKGKFRYI